MAVVKALIIAVSLAIDLFALCIGVGMRQSDWHQRLRVGSAFVCAELVMNLIGVAIGDVVHHLFGEAAGYLGFAALIVVGIYMIIESFGVEHEALDLSRGFGLFVTSLSISLDSLGTGFSIRFIGVPYALSLSLIAIASISATTLGFWLGARLGAHFGEQAGIYGGSMLAATGVVFIIMRATGHG